MRSTYVNIIDNNKIKNADKNEFLRLAQGINPEKFERLIKIQVPEFDALDFGSDFSELLKNPNFVFRQFLANFKTNSDELIKANKENRVVGK